MTTTIPAPNQTTPPPSQSAYALSRFGTIGDQLYWAWVLAEEARMSECRMRANAR